MPIIFVWRIPARAENYQVGEDVIKTTFTSNYTQWTDNTVKPRQKNSSWWDLDYMSFSFDIFWFNKEVSKWRSLFFIYHPRRVSVTEGPLKYRSVMENNC